MKPGLCTARIAVTAAAAAVLVILVQSASAQPEASCCKLFYGQHYEGSGFVVAKISDRDDKWYWGLVATARHVVVKGESGQVDASYPALPSTDKLSVKTMSIEYSGGQWCDDCTVACYDGETDCAVLWAAIPNEVEPLTLKYTPTVGSKVTQFGTRSDAGVDRGVVLEVYPTHCDLMIYVESGDSGGPVIDDLSGHVVGLMTTKCWDTEYRNMPCGTACRSQPIAALISRALSSPKPWKASR